MKQVQLARALKSLGGQSEGASRSRRLHYIKVELLLQTSLNPNVGFLPPPHEAAQAWRVTSLSDRRDVGPPVRLGQRSWFPVPPVCGATRVSCASAPSRQWFHPSARFEQYSQRHFIAPPPARRSLCSKTQYCTFLVVLRAAVKRQDKAGQRQPAGGASSGRSASFLHATFLNGATKGAGRVATLAGRCVFVVFLISTQSHTAGAKTLKLNT